MSDLSTRKMRVGLLVPSSNTIMENDLHGRLDKNVMSVHSARMYLTETSREKEIRMIEEFAPRGADDLATAKPDFLIFGCTSGGSLFGLDYDKKICEDLGRRAGCRGIGVLTAVSEALKKQGAKRLAVITPYNQDLTNSVARAASFGREIACAYGMGIEDNFALAAPTPDQIIEFTMKKLSGVKFDGIFISCTNFRALEAKDVIYERLGIPVITSNSAVIDAIEDFREEVMRESAIRQ